MVGIPHLAAVVLSLVLAVGSLASFVATVHAEPATAVF